MYYMYIFLCYTSKATTELPNGIQGLREEAEQHRQTLTTYFEQKLEEHTESLTLSLQDQVDSKAFNAENRLIAGGVTLTFPPMIEASHNMYMIKATKSVTR